MPIGSQRVLAFGTHLHWIKYDTNHIEAMFELHIPILMIMRVRS